MAAKAPATYRARDAVTAAPCLAVRVQQVQAMLWAYLRACSKLTMGTSSSFHSLTAR